MTLSSSPFVLKLATSSDQRLRAAWVGLTALLLLLSFPVLNRLLAAGVSSERQPAVVQLVIDYGDGVEKHFTKLPWRNEMTVLDALMLARKHPRGIRLEYRGQAATTMVTQIDELANQGGGGKNWIYRVNQKPGNRSCGVYPLAKGDTVLWKFETYR